MKYRVVEEIHKGTTLYRVECRGWFLWNYVAYNTSLIRAIEAIRLHKAGRYSGDVAVVYEE